MFLCKPKQVQAARAIPLVSCTPEQRCNGSIGLAAAAKGQKAPLYYPLLLQMSPSLGQGH
jgi:hypothetical protein